MDSDMEYESLTPAERRRKRREYGVWPVRLLKALKIWQHSRVTPLQRMYDTGELTPRRHRQLRVLEMYFSPALVARLRPLLPYWEETENTRSLSKLVRELCKENDLVSHELWYGPTYLPGSSAVDRLLETVELVFHPHVSSQIASNIRGFDEIAGVECTETFVAQTRFESWMGYLIDYVLSGVAATGTRFLDCDKSVLGELDRNGDPEDDLFNGEYDETFPERTLPELDKKTVAVEQISLEGRTILEAWKTHPTTRLFSRMPQGEKRLPNDPADLGPTWTPTDGGAPFAYAATNNHYNMPSWSQSPDKCVPFDFVFNQIARYPGWDTLFTTFSPLRSYLWAAFKAHMACLTLPVSELRHLQKPWRRYGGGTYRGLILNQYHYQETMPPYTRSYTIPVGRETDWGRLALDLEHVRCDDLWGCFDGIHGQGQMDYVRWPKVIHGLAYPAPQTTNFECYANSWRTAWFYSGQDFIESLHEATFAISFQRSV